MSISISSQSGNTASPLVANVLWKPSETNFIRRREESGAWISRGVNRTVARLRSTQESLEGSGTPKQKEFLSVICSANDDASVHA